MPKATLLFQEKKIYADGKILQMTIWVVPASVRGSSHKIKYSLFYGEHGQRIVAFDNEAGKGDHVHRGNVETPYTFVSPEQLVMDFLSEVRALRKGAI